MKCATQLEGDSQSSGWVNKSNVTDEFRIEELEADLGTAKEEVNTKQRELTAAIEGTRGVGEQAMSAIENERDTALAERDAAWRERDAAMKDSKELKDKVEEQERRLAALEAATTAAAAAAVAAAVGAPQPMDHLPSTGILSRTSTTTAPKVAIDEGLSSRLFGLASGGVTRQRVAAAGGGDDYGGDGRGYGAGGEGFGAGSRGRGAGGDGFGAGSSRRGAEGGGFGLGPGGYDDGRDRGDGGRRGNGAGRNGNAAGRRDGDDGRRDDGDGDDEFSDTAGNSRRGSRSRTSASQNVRKIISESNKLIDVKMVATNEITDYIESMSLLQRAVDQYYSEETQKVQIMVVMHHMDKKLRQDGNVIYDEFMRVGGWDLGKFFQELFAANWPAPSSTLRLGFDKLTQSYPLKGSIHDFSRRLRAYCELMGFELKAQLPKFIEGLTSGALRAAIRRHNLESMTFEQVVQLTVSVGNNLQSEKSNESVMVSGEGAEYPEASEQVFKIFDTDVRKYFRVADEKGVGQRCFQCFSKDHRVANCKKSSCKFCSQKSVKVRHYSLLCPRAPRNFTTFLNVRDSAVDKRTSVLKITDDFREYTFQESDFSDVE